MIFVDFWDPPDHIVNDILLQLVPYVSSNSSFLQDFFYWCNANDSCAEVMNSSKRRDF